MKYFFLIFLVAAAACNNATEKNAGTPADTVPVKKIEPEDSTTTQLRTAITAIEKRELQMASTIKWMYIDNIRHEMISLKDFYTLKKAELEKVMKNSTNKEKTANALAYLDKMITTASPDPVLYKINFHMKALLANTIAYDEEHIKFLKKDLDEMTVVFPD